MVVDVAVEGLRPSDAARGRRRSGSGALIIARPPPGSAFPGSTGRPPSARLMLRGEHEAQRGHPSARRPAAFAAAEAFERPHKFPVGAVMRRAAVGVREGGSARAPAVSLDQVDVARSAAPSAAGRCRRRSPAFPGPRPRGRRWRRTGRHQPAVVLHRDHRVIVDIGARVIDAGVVAVLDAAALAPARIGTRADALEPVDQGLVPAIGAVAVAFAAALRARRDRA
jgi:hypothetical protein